MAYDEVNARRIDIAVGTVEALGRRGAKVPPGGWQSYPGFMAGLEAACEAANRLAEAGFERPDAGGWMALPGVAAAWTAAVEFHRCQEGGR